MELLAGLIIGSVLTFLAVIVYGLINIVKEKLVDKQYPTSGSKRGE